MENILVAGATGTTGKKVVQLLKSSQYFEPIAMIRNENQKAQFEAQHIKTVLGDLENDVSHTVKNVDKVVFAAGSGGKKVREVDQEGAKKLIRASEDSKVKRFVMLSSMGAEQPKESNELYEYLKAKHNADEFLKSSNLKYVIVRPGSLTNEKGKGKIKLAESFDEFGEISRDDVAQTLVRSLHDDAANKTVFEILEGDTLIGKALEIA